MKRESGMDIILLGAQASGKGTQAELLTKTLGIPHVSSGDLFREEVNRRTEMGKQVQQYLNQGRLVPDDLTVAMVLHRLRQADCLQGALLDGFPRTLAQAYALDQGVKVLGRQIDAVMYLEVSREELYRRIAGRFICKASQHIYNIHSCPPKVPGICDLDGSELYQRSDDRGEVVRTRLDTFFALSILLLDYYEAQGKVARVNGNQCIEKVHQELIDSMRLREHIIVDESREEHFSIL
jgi:adenylate kinase